MNGHATAPAATWAQAKNAEGRVYFYNTVTKETQWTKPVELMSIAERALADQPWKEYTTSPADGPVRKYWYNTETKASSWEMPAVYKEALSKEAAPQTPVAPAPTFVAGGGFANTQYDHRDREPLGETRQIAYGNDNSGSRGQSFVPTNTDPDYNTFEEAEAAFMKLLRRHNISPDWTWEKTMRNIIKDPQYRALKDPKDRKAAFEKYAVEVRVQEKDKAKERLAKLRTDFATMLRSHPEIKHYTRWKTARPIIAAETIFRSTDNDNERRQLFEDYIIELKKAYTERETNNRKAAAEELVEILEGLDLEPYTKWSVAQSKIESNPRYQGDQKFQSLTKSDLLTAFDNHIKTLEKTFNDARQQVKNQKARRERQNRDRFLDLLKELKKNNKIKAGSTWTNVHPLIENDERYVAMLGQSGSTPLDLFWDMVEEGERDLRIRRNDVLDVLDDKRFEIQSKTTFEEFHALMINNPRTADMNRDDLALIFERLHKKIAQRSEDDKHQAERQQRRAIDNLRSFIKHLDPPVRIDDSFERIRPRIERSEEFLAVTSDELARSAFDKVIRRLKEKDEEVEKDRLKRRERHSVDRPTHRDRERSDRPHRPIGRHVRPSRSPEPDAYEADRRKAIADREKNYRKSSVADTLLSPGRRPERERGDIDRPHRSRRDDSSHYERDRRDPRDARETDREKLYRRRGDPRGSIDELPWGDDRPVTSRRRRADSAESAASVARVAKKVKRERSPVPALPPKEEPAVHSGSEEGEIEEE